MEDKFINKEISDPAGGICEPSARSPQNPIRENSQIKGIIITLIAGTLWGFSGTCAQFLFDDYGITPMYLTNVRMIVAGLILVILSLIRYRYSFFSLLKNKKDFTRLLLFAFLGILFNQISYLETISYTNSGTATILQYVGPVLVMITNCVIKKRLPNKKEVIAVILVIIGTWLIATHGDPTSLYITTEGLIWGLLSAVAVVFYTLLPIKLLKGYGSVPVVGAGMLLGGIVLSIVNRFKGGPVSYDGRYIFYLALIILVGTVIAYTIYLLGVSLCGAVKASMIASIEPVSATLCMVLWLGEAFYAMDLLGFLCIFVTVFLLVGEEMD